MPLTPRLRTPSSAYQRKNSAAYATSPAGQEYKNIARRLLGEEVPMRPMEEDRGLFKWLARLFKGQ